MKEIELGRARRALSKGSHEKWKEWEAEKHGSAIQEKSYETKIFSVSFQNEFWWKSVMLTSRVGTEFSFQLVAVKAIKNW